MVHLCQCLFNDFICNNIFNRNNKSVCLDPNNKSMKHLSSLAEFSCDENAFPEHLKQRINYIISRKKDNSQNTPKNNDGDILFNNDNDDSIDNNWKSKLSKEERY